MEGATFPCPKCGKSHCKAYDTHIEMKRHLDFHNFRCCFHARVPRIKCPECGVVTVSVPWGRRHSGFTYEYEAIILAMASSMPISKVAELIKEHDTRIFRVVTHYVKIAIDNADYSQIWSISIDETSRKKGHNYVTIIIDLVQRRVIFATPGKDHTTVDQFKKFLEEHKGDTKNIIEGCCDMSPSFIQGLTDNFPNISIVFDKFHVMKNFNEAVDSVRKMEQKNNSLLLKSRYYWLKNRDKLNEEEKKQLDILLDLNLKISKAYKLKLDLQEFWKFDDLKAAEEYLRRWFWRATHSRMEQIRDAAWTIKRHWEGILNIISSKISNGIIEAMNGTVQTIKREGRGYSNPDNFITMIYLRLGKLPLNDSDGLYTLSKVDV